ncbi:MAG: hypothetical protein ACTS8Z_07715 [Candidatus Limnocylindrales bacterium]
MATTDAKSGFRLPWSADRGESDSPVDVSADDPSTGVPASPDQENETPEMIDAAPHVSDQAVTTDDEPTPAAPEPASVAEPTPAEPTPPTAPVARKPNKFMADLTRAMQAAAETARTDTLGRFGTDAKAHIETIHASTATEATELRKRADDDVAAIREWSKTEIARIREETDERITHRKTVLEREIEAHAAEIEARIDLVQKRVNAFEAEMAQFFERLLAEDDPTRFASMAESLPEPPPFDTNEPWEPVGLIGDSEPSHDATVALSEPADIEAEATPQAEAEAATETEIGGDATETIATADFEASGDPDLGEGTTTDDAGDVFSIGADDSAAAETDPRLTALGVTPDFAAAEAEAAALAEPASTDEEIPVIGDDALAARLAGLVPEGEAAASDAASSETSSAEAPAADIASTRVIVTGLVSVASIAGFKRNLSRVAGVQSVGVSSGPDGEFVFAIGHDAGLALGDAITTLQGFAARVTNSSEGELTVSARDPESEG